MLFKHIFAVSDTTVPYLRVEAVALQKELQYNIKKNKNNM